MVGARYTGEKTAFRLEADGSHYRDQFVSDQRMSNALDQYQLTDESLVEARAQIAHIVGRHRALAGGEVLRETLESDRLSTPGERVRAALYVQDELRLEGGYLVRFQRFHISTNGGSTGAGGVEIAPIPGVIFEEVFAAPDAGWIADSAEDFAFDQGDRWYDYDSMTHVLKPRQMVWVVRTNGGSTIKLEITGYYDDAGTAGWLTLHWAPL